MKNNIFIMFLLLLSSLSFSSCSKGKYVYSISENKKNIYEYTISLGETINFSYLTGARDLSGTDLKIKEYGELKKIYCEGKNLEYFSIDIDDLIRQVSVSCIKKFEDECTINYVVCEYKNIIIRCPVEAKFKFVDKNEKMYFIDSYYNTFLEGGQSGIVWNKNCGFYCSFYNPNHVYFFLTPLATDELKFASIKINGISLVSNDRISIKSTTSVLLDYEFFKPYIDLYNGNLYGNYDEPYLEFTSCEYPLICDTRTFNEIEFCKLVIDIEIEDNYEELVTFSGGTIDFDVTINGMNEHFLRYFTYARCFDSNYICESLIF